MANILKTFEKTDCIHYSLVEVRRCCGQSKKLAGFCTITDPDGHNRNKLCSLKMRYCRYQPKEEDDVHPEEL